MVYLCDMKKKPIEFLDKAGIKPTSNRLLVVRELLDSPYPLSLTELEDRIVTLDKSSVFRVLTLFLKHDLVHDIEDGRGIVKYEICHGDGHCSISDMHAHFYCEKCHKVYCFEDVAAPALNVPDNFSVKSVNYMMKGTCPDCQD